MLTQQVNLLYATITQSKFICYISMLFTTSFFYKQRKKFYSTFCFEKLNLDYNAYRDFWHHIPSLKWTQFFYLKYGKPPTSSYFHASNYPQGCWSRVGQITVKCKTRDTGLYWHMFWSILLQIHGFMRCQLVLGGIRTRKHLTKQVCSKTRFIAFWFTEFCESVLNARASQYLAV
jgi:hypothetical protein